MAKPAFIQGIIGFGKTDWQVLGGTGILIVGSMILVYLIVALLSPSAPSKPETKKVTSTKTNKTTTKTTAAKGKSESTNRSRSKSRSKSPAPPTKKSPSPAPSAKRSPSPKPSTPPKKNTRASRGKKAAQEAGPWTDYDPAVAGSVVKNGVKKSTRKNKGKNPTLME